MSNDLVAEIQNLVADVMQVPDESIGPNTTSEDIEAWDSVQHLVLMLALEERFAVIVTPEEASELRTPVAIAQYLQDSIGSA